MPCFLRLVVALVLVGVGAAPALNAQEVPSGAVPYEHLGDFVSAPGETEDAFLLRLAPELRDYADRTGYESCGVVGSDGNGRFGVVLGSNQSHIACLSNTFAVLPGMSSTGQTIHSHGRVGSFEWSAVDKRLAESDVAALTDDTIRAQDVETFSPGDYRSGPGYLAVPGGLLHQDGTAYVSVVGAP